MADPHLEERGIWTADAGAFGDGQVVRVHLVLAGVQVYDQELAVIPGLYLPADALGVERVGTGRGIRGRRYSTSESISGGL